MGRVLLVEEDAASRALLRDAVIASGHEPLEAPDAHEALVLASSSGVDLVVCDLNPAGMTALELRRELRRVLAAFPVPFVFVTADVAKDGPAILELARVEYLFLFHKPPDPVKFKRALDALVGAQRVVEGSFGDAAFDGILGTIERGEESGVLTAYRGSIVKKIAFEEGKVTFCGSNDPRERTGHALIKAGLISEDDLKQALEMQEGTQTISPLTSILEKLGKATSTQMDEVIAKKFREAVLELYLWQEGTWVFQGGAVAIGNPSRLTLELAPLRAEGMKRAPRWRAVTAMLPSDEIRFELQRDKFPAGFPANAGDKKLVDLISRGLSLGAMRLELAGQDYAVLVRLAELVKLGILEKPGLPGPGPMEAEQVAERAALAAAAAKSTGVTGAPLPKGLRPAFSPPAAAPPAPLPPPADTLVFEEPAEEPADEEPEFLSMDALVPADGGAPPVFAPPPPILAPPPPKGAPAPPPPPLSAPPPPASAPPAPPAPPADPMLAMLAEADTVATVREALGTTDAVGDRAAAVETLMSGARAALQANDLMKAAKTFQGILRIEPSHVLARRGLAQVDALLARRAEGAGILRHSHVALAVTREQAAQLTLSTEEGFVISRITETPSPVDALVSICPIPESELLEILRRFLSEGWVAVT